MAGWTCAGARGILQASSNRSGRHNPQKPPSAMLDRKCSRSRQNRNQSTYVWKAPTDKAGVRPPPPSQLATLHVCSALTLAPSAPPLTPPHLPTCAPFWIGQVLSLCNGHMVPGRCGE